MNLTLLFVNSKALNFLQVILDVLEIISIAVTIIHYFHIHYLVKLDSRIILSSYLFLANFLSNDIFIYYDLRVIKHVILSVSKVYFNFDMHHSVYYQDITLYTINFSNCF